MLPCRGYSHSIPKQARLRAIYCLPPFTFPDRGPEPHQSLQTKPKVQPAVFIPSCPPKYLTAFSKAWCVCMCMCARACVLAESFVLVSEVRLVNIFINKYQCLASPDLSPHNSLQARRSLCPIPAASVLMVAPSDRQGVGVEPGVLAQALDSNMVEGKRAGKSLIWSPAWST